MPKTFILFFSLFFSGTLVAQWTVTGSNISNSNAGNVGIGTSAGFQKLTVRGGIGLTALGQLSADAAGHFDISADNGSLIGGIPGKHLLLQTKRMNNALLDQPAGNVGIGTVPNEARFVVQGAAGSMTALFGKGQQGIALTQNWPGIGFNSYHTATGWKSMAAGFGMVWHCDPGNGSALLIMHGNATASNQNRTERVPLVITHAGNVLIGTSTDAGYKLAVNGTILAKEIRVRTDWADYVFADDYPLRPLAEVETFIKENKHLPEMQPAAEIQKNGLDLSATTTKMMAKIEELTLYLLAQNKRLETLETENAALKQRVNILEQ